MLQSEALFLVPYHTAEPTHSTYRGDVSTEEVGVHGFGAVHWVFLFLCIFCTFSPRRRSCTANHSSERGGHGCVALVFTRRGYERYIEGESYVHDAAVQPGGVRLRVIDRSMTPPLGALVLRGVRLR